MPQRQQHFDSVLHQSLPGIHDQVSLDVAATSSSRMASCVGVGSDDGRETDVGDAAAAAAAADDDDDDCDNDDDDVDDDDVADAAVMNVNNGLPVEDRHPPSGSPTGKSADHTCS